MTQNVTLDKQYDPKAVEGDIYALWERSGAFAARPDARGPELRFTIVIPPPNVTGALHMGHALNNTLQDIQIRYHRMRGDNTLWVPGTDHAGIATQAVVEKRIFETEGKTRHDLGREELVRRIWEWKDQYEKRILGQLKVIGCSCDWDRTRFTFDEGNSRAVRETFFRWFKDGLIYRGKRLVNWDTALQTAVADDEVYHATVKGKLTHIRYPIAADPSRDREGAVPYLVVATTRPETMLGDTAVAVHPDDPRYKHLIGKCCILPLMNREIPIIADPILVDPKFGTGCVKVTPAHDPNDYQTALRHNLPMINMLTPDGRVNEVGRSADGKYSYVGKPREEARKKVVEDLEALGLIEKIEDYSREVGHSDRSKTPIEPYLSDQWFVKMGDVAGGITLGDGSKASGLAQAAMDAVTSGRVKIFPERYAKSYLDWLGEKRDWCISRQLWWGHRIPVWHRRIRYTRANLDMRNSEGLTSLGLDHVLLGETPTVGIFVTHVASGKPFDPYAWTPNWLSVAFEDQPERKVDAHDLQKWQNGELEGEFGVYLCILDEDYSKYFEAKGFVQDPDVLDTWFSSQLWPFSTLGWPDDLDEQRRYGAWPLQIEKKGLFNAVRAPDLAYYYPTSVLITSRDIITLWVARMVISGLYNLGVVPFHHVYIHTKILDGRGETMSKSKGNGVDPADIVEAYGADALRYCMADLATDMQDVRMPVDYKCPHCGHLVPQTSVVPHNKQPSDMKQVTCKSCKKPFATQWADEAIKKELPVARETSDRFEIGRNFSNKVWNAARYAFMNLSPLLDKEGLGEVGPREGFDSHRTSDPPLSPLGKGGRTLNLADLPIEDRWILAKLSQTCRRVNDLITRYQYSAMVKTLRDFFWDSLCDWYIELTKGRLNGGTKATEARQVLAFVFDQTLRLMHPLMPFITERLWQQLNEIVPDRSLPGLTTVRTPHASEGAMTEVAKNTDDLLITAQFPPAEGWPALDDPDILDIFDDVQAATSGVRNLRSQCNISPKQSVTVTLKCPAGRVAALREQSGIISHMAAVRELIVDPNARRPKNAASAAVGSLLIIVHDISDDEAEKARCTKELDSLAGQIAGKESKLSNEKFVAHADPDVVAAERDRLDELKQRRRTLEETLAHLEQG